MTINHDIASSVRSGTTAQDEYDARFGRYAEKRAPEPYEATPSEPVGAAQQEPPQFAAYQDEVQDMPVERRVGLDVMPRFETPFPYLKR